MVSYKTLGAVSVLSFCQRAKICCCLGRVIHLPWWRLSFFIRRHNYGLDIRGMDKASAEILPSLLFLYPVEDGGRIKCSRLAFANIIWDIEFLKTEICFSVDQRSISSPTKSTGFSLRFQSLPCVTILSNQLTIKKVTSQTSFVLMLVATSLKMTGSWLCGDSMHKRVLIFHYSCFHGEFPRNLLLFTRKMVEEDVRHSSVLACRLNRNRNIW